jgi:Methyltransferase domain
MRPMTSTGLGRRLLMPLDTLERHRVAANLLGDAVTVLDVGGVQGELVAFLPGRAVTTANIRAPADVIYDGATLPFPDRAFDAVASLDVLEHVAPGRRRLHVEELTRVAERRVVVCCPLGSGGHAAAERELAEHLRAGDAGHAMLEQHLVLGLPTEEELRVLVRDAPFRFELLFHGDYRRAAELVRLGAEAHCSPIGLVRYAARRVLTRPRLHLAGESGPFTNRVFMVGGRSD